MNKTKWEHFKDWQNTRDNESFAKYKKVNKDIKKVVSEAKHKAYDNFYTSWQNLRRRKLGMFARSRALRVKIQGFSLSMLI